MPGKSHKLDTPSGGQDEVRAALLRGHATPGSRGLTLPQVKRHLGPRYDDANVTTVLGAVVAAGDAEVVSAGVWRLLAQGHRKARSKPNPRYVASS